MRLKILFFIILGLLFVRSAHAIPGISHTCTAAAQSLTVSCNITGAVAGEEYLMWTYTCGAACFQPLTSDITITPSDTLGGGLTWVSPTSGMQQYNGSTSTCNYTAGTHCNVKEKIFYANTGANSGNDTLTFTIAFTGTQPACNCGDLRITVLELSSVIGSPFDGSNGTSALCSGACGGAGATALTDGTITIPAGVFTSQVTVAVGNATFGYSMIFVAFRGTDTKDLLLVSSSCSNCGGYVTQSGWTHEAGASGLPVLNGDSPTIYYQSSGNNVIAVMRKKGFVN